MIHVGYPRSRSSIHLSTRIVLKIEVPGTDGRLQRLGHALGCRPSDVAVGGVELGHRRFERNGLLLPLEVDADAAEHLFIEPRPGRDAGDGLLGEDLLLRLREQVGTEHALRREPVTPVVEGGILEQRRCGLVVDRGPLEAEEEELRLEARRLLAELRDERATGGIGHVRGEGHVRVVEGARRHGLDPLVLRDRVGELRRRQGRDLAVGAIAEGGRGGFSLCEVALDAWVVA